MGKVLTRSESDLVREHARETYLQPARRRGETRVSIHVGTVHKVLALNNRVPLVCAALTSKKFLDENALTLISKTGPPSGQSTTVTLTYEILSGQSNEAGQSDPLFKLRGIGKDLFRALGGGEAFIREERKGFSESSRIERPSHAGKER